MPTTTSASSDPNLPTSTLLLVSTTFTTESLVIALSASEKTVEIFEGVTSIDGAVITHHLTIQYTGTTAFPSASVPGVGVYTSVETSWKYINLSTITTPQARPSSTESPTSEIANPISRTTLASLESAIISSQTSSETAKATSTPIQAPPVSAGLKSHTKLGISTGFSLGAVIFVIVLVVCLRVCRRRRNKLQIGADGASENVQGKPELEAGKPGIHHHAEAQFLDHEREMWWEEFPTNAIQPLDRTGFKSADLDTAESLRTDGDFEAEGVKDPGVDTIRRKQTGSSVEGGIAEHMEIGRAL